MRLLEQARKPYRGLKIQLKLGPPHWLLLNKIRWQAMG
jgi:hypothetical protein